MGENKHIEELDAFAKKYVKELTPESPSFDFTANIMEAVQQEKVFVYNAAPLISKPVWVGLISLVIAAIAFVSKGKSMLNGWRFSDLFTFNLKVELPSLFDHISVSNTVLYSSCLFTVLLFFQIYLLTNRLGNK